MLLRRHQEGKSQREQNSELMWVSTTWENPDLIQLNMWLSAELEGQVLFSSSGWKGGANWLKQLILKAGFDTSGFKSDHLLKRNINLHIIHLLSSIPCNPRSTSKSWIQIIVIMSLQFFSGMENPPRFSYLVQTWLRSIARLHIGGSNIHRMGVPGVFWNSR